MNNQPNIAILVLAAGNSSRMGKPKQLLPWKNTFLLNHAINTATQLDNTKTFVVLGANIELIKSKILNKDIKIINNKNWNSGLGSSIAKGVKHLISTKLNYDGILIMLADQPLVDSTFLNKIISIFKTEEKQIIASKYGQEKLGVPALFNKIYFEELLTLNEDKGAKQILNENIKNLILLNAEHLIADIDTKEDYERMYKTNHQ